VNVALHADDAPALGAAELSNLPADARSGFRRASLRFPREGRASGGCDLAQRIEEDDAATWRHRSRKGPVFLVISRGPDGVRRCRASAKTNGSFAQSLFAGVPFSRAVATANTDMAPSLAAHLAAGRFTDVHERIPE
jgi:hypothetical protein